MRFKKKSSNITLDIDLPNGMFYRSTLDRKIYFKRSGKLFYVSEIVFGTWNAPALAVNQRNLDHYEIAGKLGFRDGTLLKDFVSGRIYLISDSRKRLVDSPRAFQQLGGEEAVLTVNSSYIEMHRDGAPIDD